MPDRTCGEDRESFIKAWIDVVALQAPYSHSRSAGILYAKLNTPAIALYVPCYREIHPCINSWTLKESYTISLVLHEYCRIRLLFVTMFPCMINHTAQVAHCFDRVAFRECHALTQTI